MTEGVYSRIHPVYQFIILVAVTFGLMIAGGLLGALICWAIYGLEPLLSLMHNGVNPQVVNLLWVLQITSTTVPLFAGPYIFARFIVKEPKPYLKANLKFNPLLLPVVLAIMLFSMPLMELLININQKMILPQFLKGVEKWMRDSETEAAKETAVLLNFKSVWQMLWALLIVGLFTAIAEEFFFRGCIQTIFSRLTKSHHWGIWIAAILFSAIHMQFFGFLPRLMLGVFFGYFVWWSGSTWTSVWGHFINNGMAVVTTYLYQHKKITMNPDDQHIFNYGLYAFSLIITVLLFIVYRKLTVSQKSLPDV
jgi:membrane protease YdiL (CAAX protease family)